MRKVLSFVLVLALVLGSFSMAFAATPTDVAGTDYSEAVTVLSGLGVVAGYADGTYKPAQAVTRAEMAKLIVVALGLEDYAVGTSKFTDMAGATWAQGYVNYAAGLGIILGYPDGTFKPSQTVSYDEAVAMIVRALGYTDASLLPATWPANYVVKAKALGVLADITAKVGGADRGDVAIMLYNALSLELGGIDNDSGKWVATTPSDKMITRLGAEGPTAFTVSAADVGDEDVTIVDLSAYVYASIDVYTVDDVIVSVADVNSDALVGEFTSVTSIALSTITLADDTDVKLGANATAATKVYLNGGQTTFGAIGSLSNSLLNGYDITVYGDLNDDEDSFTTVAGIIAWAPTSIELVGSSDVDDIADVLIDGNGTVLGIDLPTVDNDGDVLDLDIISVVGDATKLADIQENDVVYVYAAANDPSDAKVKFEVVRDSKDVTVSKKTSTKVYVGATAYELATFNFTDADVAIITDFTVGDDYTIYLGNDGKIVFTEVTATTPDVYGVLVATDDAISFGNTDYIVKLLTADNDFVVFDIDDDATFEAEILTIATGSAIAYTVDADGIITDVTTTSAVLSSDTYNSRTNVLDGHFVADGVVVFDITGASADWNTTTLADGDVFTSGKYFVNDDNEIVAIVSGSFTGGSSDATYFAVNSLGAVLNSDDDLVLELSGFNNGVAAVSLADAEFASYLDDAPVVWTVTYSGVVVSSIDITPNYTTTAATVVDASDVFVKVTKSAVETIYEVSTDVIVYVAVYDADGDLDSYKVGSMDDVTDGDVLSLILNSDVEVELIVLTQRADVSAS